MTAKSTAIVVFFATIASCHTAGAVTYRVGPTEACTAISDIADRLLPGDVVEVTGDIVDSVTLRRSGSQDRPIVIRGITHTDKGRVIRPRITSMKRWEFVCGGNCYRIENLEFDGRPLPLSEVAGGLKHECDGLTIRNCYFHHFRFKAIVGSPDGGSITIEFCEFDSCGNYLEAGRTVDIWSWTPGAVMRVEHCFFHNALGEALLKSHCTRNIIRYNWFEDTCDRTLKVVDRIGEVSPRRPDKVYPMHSDIVGNVLIQGRGTEPRFSVFALGGAGTDTVGTEGDFNIAHNLIVMSRCGVVPVDPPAYVHIHGNVDHIRMYNNIFLQIGGSRNLVYLREDGWDTPETRDFIRRRGSPDPIVEGSNNWVFEKSAGIPETFKNTLRALNPKFVDLLSGDYRPRKDSPLAGAGLWPLPKGRIVDLVPEYEPQRGIPADLKPKVRRKVTPPSIGPFEVAE